MALAIALVVLIITIISLILFGLHIWWFPEVISSYGLAIDHQFKVIFIVTGIIFVLALLVSLSVLEAKLIIAYFMHLRHEWLSLAVSLMPAHRPLDPASLVLRLPHRRRHLRNALPLFPIALTMTSYEPLRDLLRGSGGVLSAVSALP